MISKPFLAASLISLLVFFDLTVTAQNPPVSNSLLGKVICGYQGWFNCYDDGSPVNSWRHWSAGRSNSKDKLPCSGNLTFEAFPDISEYKPECLFQTGFDNLGNGLPAKLFSSNKSEVIDLHFSWMQKYGIDGVALQRFLGETKSPRFKEQRDSVSVKVMHSAEKYSRIFYLMYDMSANDTSFFQNDVLHIEKDLKIFKSPNYIHQNGKPVICIWGFGFNHRLNAPEASLAMINWLKAKGYYVIGGVPTNWLSGTIDSYNNYFQVYRAFDMISPWTVGRFKNNAEADKFKTNYLEPEQEYCKAKGIDYLPVVFPGFAWSNWNGGTPNQIARNKGDFLWRQVFNIKSLGISNMYVAMFDEYDEGTVIAKMADSYFSVPTNQYFLTSSADGTYISSDFYLRLVGKATQTIKGELPLKEAHDVPLQAAPIWFRTSFEPQTDALPNIIDESQIRTESVCELSDKNAASGKWSLKVIGATSGFRTSIFDVAIQVSENTILSYQIFPENKSGEIAFIDLITTNGNRFNEHKTSGQIKMNEWNNVELHIGHQLKGKTVSKIAVGYEKTSRSGTSTCFIDNISIVDGRPDKTENLTNK